MQVFRMRRGDTRPALRYKFPKGTDLTGAQVRFFVDGVVAGSPASIIAKDVAQYDWRAGDTEQTGKFEIMFKILYPDSGIESSPVGSPMFLVVEDSL